MHRHLDGNLRLETVLDLALENYLELPALELVEAVAEKHHLSPEKVETILRELETLAVDVEG